MFQVGLALWKDGILCHNNDREEQRESRRQGSRAEFGAEEVCHFLPH